MDELIPQQQVEEEVLRLDITEVLQNRLDELNKRFDDLKIEYKSLQKQRTKDYGER